MATSPFRIASILTGAALLLTACTVKQQEVPPLTGPSELSTALNISVTPDVLSQDGASQSLVTITARDANGQLVRNLALRAEIAVNGIIADFGRLSAKNVVTDTNGQATLIYTAPAAPPVATDNGTTVQILVVPSGNNFDNATARFASIRLVPPNVVTPPSDLNAVFSVSPTAPTEDNTVLFDATASIGANPTTTIVSFSWDFGDGSTGSGRQTTNHFEAGTYTVTLTIRDVTGRSGTARSNLTVTPAITGLSVPVLSFSPSPVRVGEVVHFEANATINVPHQIVSYTWNFGDGTIRTTTEPRADFTYTVGGGRTYSVTVRVTDDTGQFKTSNPVPITPQ